MYRELEAKKGLPARYFHNTSKISDKTKEVFMDAFEEIALEQFRENIDRFGDYYRMYDNEMSSLELRDLVPMFDTIGATQIFENYDIPTTVHHHDLIGRVIKAFIGKLADMEDKFFITDLGEEGKNDFLQQLEDLYHESLTKLIRLAVEKGFVSAGIDPNTQQTFNSEEEQQAYMQQLQQMEEELSPESAVSALKKSFKSVGAKWGEATLEKDTEEQRFKEIYSELFKHFLLSGMPASITKVYENHYKKYALDSRTVFHSKDIGKKFLQDYDYAGTITYMNDTQVLEQYGDYLNIKDKEHLLGGKDGKWQIDVDADEYGHTSPNKFINGDFGFTEWVPYSGYRHAMYMKRIQDMIGEPMGYTRRMTETGQFSDTPSYITDVGEMNYQYNNVYHIENRFIPNNNLFQVTEVYFHVLEDIGYFYHTTEEGFPTMTIVDANIDKEMLKEMGVKQIKTKSYSELSEEQPINTIIWSTRSRVWKGVKISSPMLKRSYYPIFEMMPFQITGENDFDTKLPISGYIGKNIADGMAPYQYAFNVVNNQIRQLTEKELGMFFTIDMMSLPQEIRESGEVEDVISTMRNMAKEIGLMPTISNPEDIQNGSNHRNLFGAHNISHASEIQTRIQLSDYYEVKCYQAAGLNMQKELSDTKYSTATGIKMSNETMSNQISDIFEQFNSFIRADKIQHLTIAQYAQSNEHDSSLFYTKDDASIEWLRFSKEHRISLRKLGISVTSDSRRRKEFEDAKMWLLNNNTTNADVKSLIELMTSDTMSVLRDAANESREHSDAQAQMAHERQMKEIQAQAEAIQAQEQAKWERDELSKDKDRQNKIDVERIESFGRLGGQDTPQEAFDRVDRAVRLSQSEMAMNLKHETDMAKINATTKSSELSQSIEQRRLDQKDRELDLKEKAIEAKREGDRINKN